MVNLPDNADAPQAEAIPEPTASSLPEESNQVRSFKVWDAVTRFLHAYNMLLIFMLLVTGYLFMYRGWLHIDTKPAKMGMKAIHSLLGYAFLGGLLARLAWAFLGNRFARWSEVLPTRRSMAGVKDEVNGLLGKRSVRMRIGHGPLGRLSSTALLVGSLVVASAGLVRAGTDLYYLPFGPIAAEFVAKEGVDPSVITWKTEELVVAEKIAAKDRFSFPFGRIHWYGSWVIIALIIAHVMGLVVKEIRTGGSVFSSMVSGKKLYRPKDVHEDDYQHIETRGD